MPCSVSVLVIAELLLDHMASHTFPSLKHDGKHHCSLEVLEDVVYGKFGYFSRLQKMEYAAFFCPERTVNNWEICDSYKRVSPITEKAAALRKDKLAV